MQVQVAWTYLVPREFQIHMISHLSEHYCDHGDNHDRLWRGGSVRRHNADLAGSGDTDGIALRKRDEHSRVRVIQNTPNVPVPMKALWALVLSA